MDLDEMLDHYAPRVNQDDLMAHDGIFEGRWSAYHLDFSDGHVCHRVKTKEGVRGINCKVRVTVLGGKIVDIRG